MTKRDGAGRRSARAVEMDTALRELEESGLGVAAFARERGIALSTLRWWRAKRRRGARAKGTRRGGRPPRLVEVIGSRGPAARSGAGFEVTLGNGRRVVVPMGFDVEALRVLIRTLDAPC
jgi:hypothetical protein